MAICSVHSLTFFFVFTTFAQRLVVPFAVAWSPLQSYCTRLSLSSAQSCCSPSRHFPVAIARPAVLPAAQSSPGHPPVVVFQSLAQSSFSGRPPSYYCPATIAWSPSSGSHRQVAVIRLPSTGKMRKIRWPNAGCLKP